MSDTDSTQQYSFKRKFKFNNNSQNNAKKKCFVYLIGKKNYYIPSLIILIFFYIDKEIFKKKDDITKDLNASTFSQKDSLKKRAKTSHNFYRHNDNYNSKSKNNNQEVESFLNSNRKQYNVMETGLEKMVTD